MHVYSNGLSFPLYMFANVYSADIYFASICTVFLLSAVYLYVWRWDWMEKQGPINNTPSLEGIRLMHKILGVWQTADFEAVKKTKTMTTGRG